MWGWQPAPRKASRPWNTRALHLKDSKDSVDMKSMFKLAMSVLCLAPFYHPNKRNTTFQGWLSYNMTVSNKWIQVCLNAFYLWGHVTVICKDLKLTSNWVLWHYQRWRLQEELTESWSAGYKGWNDWTLLCPAACPFSHPAQARWYNRCHLSNVPWEPHTMESDAPPQALNEPFYLFPAIGSSLWIQLICVQ